VRNLLLPANRPVLERLARPNSLLAFDFDGTLAPIVPHRDEARLTSRTRSLLRELSRRQPCVLVTGRGRADVKPKVRGVDWAAIVGNHGAEWDPPLGRGKEWEAQVKQWGRILPPFLKPLAGVDLETKRFSLSVHYRASHSPKAALKGIKLALGALGPHRTIGGKRVLNILPDNLPDKGWAVKHLQRKLNCPYGFYVGDDLTDEDVFRAVSTRKLATIHIGKKGSSAAQFYLPGQPSCDELLKRILGLGRQ
jgi:trehalose 6-phosphate phosphatase